MKNIEKLRPDLETTKRSYFSALFKISSVEGQEGERTVSTKFLKWDDFLTELYDKFTKWMQAYNETFITLAELRYVDTGLIQQSIVYGSMKDLLVDFYRSMTKDENKKKKLFRFLKNHKIGHRRTKRNCFYYSVIHGMEQTEDEEIANIKIRTIRNYFNLGDEPRELEHMANTLSYHYNIQIWVYDGELNIACKYGEEYPQIVKIMIYANHSFYILNKGGSKVFYDIDKKLNEQNPMNNIEDNEDDEEDDENDNKKEEYILYGAYDAETYNEIKEDENNIKKSIKIYGPKIRTMTQH